MNPSPPSCTLRSRRRSSSRAPTRPRAWAQDAPGSTLLTVYTFLQSNAIASSPSAITAFSEGRHATCSSGLRSRRRGELGWLHHSPKIALTPLLLAYKMIQLASKSSRLASVGPRSAFGTVVSHSPCISLTAELEASIASETTVSSSSAPRPPPQLPPYDPAALALAQIEAAVPNFAHLADTPDDGQSSIGASSLDWRLATPQMASALSQHLCDGEFGETRREGRRLITRSLSPAFFESCCFLLPTYNYYRTKIPILKGQEWQLSPAAKVSCSRSRCAFLLLTLFLKGRSASFSRGRGSHIHSLCPLSPLLFSLSELTSLISQALLGITISPDDEKSHPNAPLLSAGTRRQSACMAFLAQAHQACFESSLAEEVSVENLAAILSLMQMSICESSARRDCRRSRLIHSAESQSSSSNLASLAPSSVQRWINSATCRIPPRQRPNDSSSSPRSASPSTPRTLCSPRTPAELVPSRTRT